MIVGTTCCDVCGRSPNGDSPDSTLHYSCGHDICNEERAGKSCPICKEGLDPYEAIRLGIPSKPSVYDG